jgi:AraC family transcriptional activator of pobA
MSFAEISYLLGFADPAYFSRFFKKHCSETPAQFRKRA